WSNQDLYIFGPIRQQQEPRHSRLCFLPVCPRCLGHVLAVFPISSRTSDPQTTPVTSCSASISPKIEVTVNRTNTLSPLNCRRKLVTSSILSSCISASLILRLISD